MNSQATTEMLQTTAVETNGPLSQAVLREEHGIPVNGLSDSYLFKVDDEEFARLDVHHAMFSASLDGLFPTTVRDDIHEALTSRSHQHRPAVLDIGTGSGAWAIDMAKAFPDADVVGMDLVPAKLSTIPPSNCRFEVGNADTDLADMYGDASFDFIHARSMMQGVKDFQRFHRNMARMLRPGGVFITLDGRLTTWDEERKRIPYREEGEPGFSPVRKMIHHMRKVLDTRNPNMELMDRLAECLRGIGDGVWEKVDEYNLYLPIGDWDSPTLSPNEQLGGKFLAQSLSMLPDSIRPLLLSSTLTPDEVDRLAMQVRVEMKEPEVKQLFLFIYTWAVKK
ncbi:hypothetical protein FRB90_004929 [Tulasnella sp. 427]|nr:hypothetical protein FRB90_004929 [Tulasnella sp. 427]